MNAMPTIHFTPGQDLPKPPFKSLGGKTKLLPELFARVPAKFGKYYEPFFGGGAFFWALHRTNMIRAYSIADTNGDLTTTLEVIRDKAMCEQLILRLGRMKNDAETFARVRSDHLPRHPVNQAVRFVYLNKTAFNGLWRVNSKGRHNAPFGGYAKPLICDEANLRACHEALAAGGARSTIVHTDFEESVAGAKSGDLVYFDPPYYPLVEKKSFIAYTAEGFTRDDHVRLRNAARRLKGKGVHIIISNSDCEATRELYEDFKIERVTAPRSINSDGAKRGHVGELIIT